MEPADFLEYDAGQLETAAMLSEMIKDLVWPDFKVVAEGSKSRVPFCPHFVCVLYAFNPICMQFMLSNRG